MATKKPNLPLSPADKLPVRAELIDRRIYIVRGKKVMLDSDLAELYQVETRVLIQAVKRNFDRFPDDFMFQLTAQETQSWPLSTRISPVSTPNGWPCRTLKPRLSSTRLCALPVRATRPIR
jgi:hypothetical protein